VANLNEAIKTLFSVEFSSKPELFLHENDGENGYTLGGIYQKSNPNRIDWNKIDKLMALFDNDIKRVSRMLYYDVKTMNDVIEIYRLNYWDMLKLDNVVSQRIAEEIFLFGVVSGVKNGAKVAQRIVNVKDDGIIGHNTLDALNRYNLNLFDTEFDLSEIKYFEELAMKKPRLKVFLNGWRNRAMYV